MSKSLAPSAAALEYARQQLQTGTANMAQQANQAIYQTANTNPIYQIGAGAGGGGASTLGQQVYSNQIMGAAGVVYNQPYQQPYSPPTIPDAVNVHGVRFKAEQGDVAQILIETQSGIVGLSLEQVRELVSALLKEACL